MGLAPGVPHFAKRPFASLQRCGFFTSTHFVNLPLASRHGALAKTDPVALISNAAASAMEPILRTIILLSQLRRSQATI